MHRPGSDPENMTAEDFLCDFCGRSWDVAAPMIEGHQGSLICGSCLTTAYRAVEGATGELAGPGLKCTLCLESRSDPEWRSPTRQDAVICRRCLKQAAGTLVKDKESGWTRPV
ncbi:MAG: ClpX C4-type zinc finger protein [Planctomycetota bacterium]|nr:ClpX C4-type zinc finger protein [Planctomycetota bacterium]